MARDRQKSYADKRRKFEVGDRVLLKVSPWKGVVRFGKKGKLAPRYVGLFEILESIGLVAYRLRLPEELSSVHDTFHVLNLNKCLADASLHVPLDEIKVDKTPRFVEKPVEIMDREIKKLKRKKIALVKVRWNLKRGPEFTWEREDYMKSKYPQLFVGRAVEPTKTPELVSEPVVNEFKCECQPYGMSDAPIIEERLGHVNFKNLNKLVKGNLVRGLPSKIFQNDHTCVACQKGKQHKASCKAKSVSSISHSLQLLHMDLFGPTSVRSLNHKTYCLVITDDFSRFSWVFFLRTKDETSGILKDFIRQIENQLNQKVKTIRCDNGTEFKNKDVIEFCGSKGIKREYSNARTPQQNRVAERKNRTLIEAARTMLADSFLPNTFWAEAVSTACYVLNRVLVTKPHNKTPYELLTGKIPIISYIRPFGCHVTILNTIDHLGKFARKSDEGFLVGYSLQSKAFRVYNLETKRVEENLHITFLENKPNVAGKGPTWLFDLDYLTDSMNYHPVRSENQANIHAGQQEANHNAGTEDIIDAGDSEKEDDSAQDCFVLPIWSSYSSTITPDLKTGEKKEGSREEEQVFLDELERLKRQEKEANEEAEALRKEFAQETENLTEDAQDVGRTSDKVDEEKENDEDVLSTKDVLSIAQEKVSTDRPIVSTDGSKVSTDRQKDSTDDQNEGTDEQSKGTDDHTEEGSATQTTQPPTSTIFGDDETIAQVLLNMSQAKAVSREKEKGVEFKDIEETERPRPTSTRSLLTLKPLPKIDPKDKGKKKIEEEDESESESDGIPEAEKKFKQLASDEEMARKVQEEWEGEEERKRLAEEEATNDALIRNYDDIKARIEADRLLAEKLQEEEREQFTVEERAKFLHDTIAAQRKFLAQQRSEAIRNRPPTKNQLRNQMMTYLKHVGNFKHSDLKTKKFEEIQALYEKIKRSDEDFISIGSAEDERLIKKMNEKEIDSSRNESVKKEEKEEDGIKKRKGGHIKMIARKKARKQSDVDSEDEHKKCLKIVTFESVLDSEIIEKKSVIARLNKVSSPDGDYLVIYRANGNFRAFNYLMEILHIFDRQDLFHLYDLIRDQFSEVTLEGFELILWGDLKIMMESSTEGNEQSDFWSGQQDWKIVTWRLYESCGVCILEFEDGIVIHMLVERRYPLSKDLLQRMLDLGLEVERESSVALDLIRHKNWLVHKQTACGKDFSNPFMVDNLPKIVGFSTHLASLVKSWLVQDQTVLALASPKANELTIPEQTATGKGTSNPFMAGSLPKTTKPT
ncbi:putative ribonuclease H-like domain-containing protein [Tanacetum coccineum]